MALSHTNLENYYNTIFSMAQHHKYSIYDLENLIPFEKDLYINMLLNYLEEEKRNRDQESLS